MECWNNGMLECWNNESTPKSVILATLVQSFLLTGQAKTQKHPGTVVPPYGAGKDTQKIR